MQTYIFWPVLSSVDRFVLKVKHSSFTMTSAFFWVTRYVHENIDSPYVFEFWVTNMLKEVPMRMFSSLTGRRNVVQEPKWTPDVSTGFRLLCWSPSDGLQHCVSILNTIIFSDTLWRITRVRNIAHPRNFATLFIITLLQYFNFLTQFIEW